MVYFCFWNKTLQLLQVLLSFFCYTQITVFLYIQTVDSFLFRDYEWTIFGDNGLRVSDKINIHDTKDISMYLFSTLRLYIHADR